MPLYEQSYHPGWLGLGLGLGLGLDQLLDKLLGLGLGLLTVPLPPLFSSVQFCDNARQIFHPPFA